MAPENGARCGRMGHQAARHRVNGPGPTPRCGSMPSHYKPETPRRRAVNSEALLVCEHCHSPYVKPTKYGYRPSRFCSRKCSTQHTAKRIPLAVRFWPKVIKGDGCWEWSGTRNARGYGKISRDHRPGTMDYAHRISWEIHFGPIPDGMDVRHFVCDNPPCVRPDHLRIGDRRANMADAMRKGRLRTGLAHRDARLSDAQVRAIRARFAAGGILQAALASEYGITERYVSQIVCFHRRRAAGAPAQLPGPSRSDAGRAR